MTMWIIEELIDIKSCGEAYSSVLNCTIRSTEELFVIVETVKTVSLAKSRCTDSLHTCTECMQTNTENDECIKCVPLVSRLC